MEGKDAALEQPAGQQSLPGMTSGDVLAALKDNFALVSAASLLISVSLATTFLAAYLSVFDWHLLWFVQYPDIITFGLLALGILSGSISLMQGFVWTVITGKPPEQRRTGLIIFALLWTVGVAFSVWIAVHNGEGYFHILSGATTLFLAAGVIFVIVRLIGAGQRPTGVQCLNTVMLLVIFAASVGRWLGDSVRETSEFNQDIALKDKDEMLTNAKLIIVMSRHTVLSKDDVLYVIPTGDITKFQRASKPK